MQSRTDNNTGAKGSQSSRSFKQTTLSFGGRRVVPGEKRRRDSEVTESQRKSHKSNRTSTGPGPGPGLRQKSDPPKPARPLAITEAGPKPESQPATATHSQDQDQDRDGQTLRIIDTAGDILDAPSGSVLIHACNCGGSWGAGIALAFRQRYPEAYKVYRAHCRAHDPDELVGTALLIAPCEKAAAGGVPRHYVGCLFTSRRYGASRDAPEQILAATEPAVRELLAHVARRMEEGADVGELRMCQINSGLFAVPWESTKTLLEGMDVAHCQLPVDIIVYSRT